MASTKDTVGKPVGEEQSWRPSWRRTSPTLRGFIHFDPRERAHRSQHDFFIRKLPNFFDQSAQTVRVMRNDLLKMWDIRIQEGLSGGGFILPCEQCRWTSAGGIGMMVKFSERMMRSLRPIMRPTGSGRGRWNSGPRITCQCTKVVLLTVD